MKMKIVLALLPMVCLGSVAVADETLDKQINQQVMDVFQQHPDLGTTIKTRTKNGVVYITGTVATGLQKANAEQLAKSVNGVKSVIDNAGVQNTG